MCKRSLVAIHGCHVGARDWERIVDGRISAALQVIKDVNADLLSFSTGASHRDGQSEARLMHSFMYEMVLGRNQYQSALHPIHTLLDTAVLDEQSQNTAEEMRKLSAVCRENGVSHLYLVSSAWHVLRCHKEALALQRAGHFHQVAIYAIGAHDALDAPAVKDVVVIEPPHRGDDPALTAEHQMHQVVAKLFTLTHEQRQSVLGVLNETIERTKCLMELSIA